MPQAGPAFSNYPAVLGCPDLLLKKKKEKQNCSWDHSGSTDYQCYLLYLLTMGGDAKHPEVLNFSWTPWLTTLPEGSTIMTSIFFLQENHKVGTKKNAKRNPLLTPKTSKLQPSLCPMH